MQADQWHEMRSMMSGDNYCGKVFITSGDRRQLTLCFLKLFVHSRLPMNFRCASIISENYFSIDHDKQYIILSDTNQRTYPSGHWEALVHIA